MDINNLTTASEMELHNDLLECARAAADPASSNEYRIRLHGSIARMAAELQRRDVNLLLEQRQSMSAGVQRLFDSWAEKA
jgi:hypothetical protein